MTLFAQRIKDCTAANTMTNRYDNIAVEGGDYDPTDISHATSLTVDALKDAKTIVGNPTQAQMKKTQNAASRLHVVSTKRRTQMTKTQAAIRGRLKMERVDAQHAAFMMGAHIEHEQIVAEHAEATNQYRTNLGLLREGHRAAHYEWGNSISQRIDELLDTASM